MFPPACHLAFLLCPHLPWVLAAWEREGEGGSRGLTSRTGAVEPHLGLNLHHDFISSSQSNHKKNIRNLIISTPGHLLLCCRLSLLLPPPPLLWSAILKFIPRTLFPGMAMLRQREEIRPSEALSSDVRDPRRSYRCCNVGLSWTCGLICMEQLVYFLSPCHAVEQSMVLAGPLYHTF